MKVDMSSRAVTARIRRVSQLRRLCLSLGKAKPATIAANFATTPKSQTSISQPEGGKVR